MPNKSPKLSPSNKTKKEAKNKFDGKAFQSFKLLLATSSLLLDIQKLRNKFNINIPLNQKISTTHSRPTPTNTKSPTDVTTLILNAKFTPRNDKRRKIQFSSAVERLLRKYSLPNLYLFVLSALISTGELHWFDDDSAEPGTYFFTTRTVDGELVMAMRIYTETSINDIHDEWPEIAASRKRFLRGEPLNIFDEREFKKTATNKRHNIDRDLRIKQLYLAGTKPKNITEIVRNEFSLKGFVYTDVNDALRKLKRKKKK